tara:strand:+ start:10131 stop:11111 length:981 start_codon:yes stop_codon:yes gene_type:complete
MDSKGIFNLLKNDLVKVEKILKDSTIANETICTDISKHIILKPGKRFRPILLLLTFLSFKKKSNSNILKAAAAVELLHSASLIHDDIVDESTMRRGQKTSNVIWGDHASVLAGDFLLSKSLWLINQTKNNHVMNSVTNAASELADGQIMDLAFSKKFNDFSIKSYFKMISLKTASLLSSCSEVGAILAGANPQKVKSMKNFGLNLGISFQIVDDMLDFTGDTKILGKRTLQDLKDGKVTLPLIMAVNSTSKNNFKKTESIIKQRKFDRKSLDFLYNLIINEDSLNKTKKEAERFAKKALTNIKALDSSIYKTALEFLLKGNLTRIT